MTSVGHDAARGRGAVSWDVDPATLVPRRLGQVTAPARGAARVLPAGLPGARWAVRRQLGGLFGAPSLSTDRQDQGAGLLPRDAVSWTVLAEPSAIAGGVRSLLVQALHPLAMAGIAEHSRYRANPLARLSGTSAWVTVATFGTGRRVLDEARRVRRMHLRVVGTARDGRHYAASDTELLVWVSIALTSSLLATHELFAPVRLSAEEADRFVYEQARGAALLDPRVDIAALDPDGLASLDQADLPLLADLPTDRAGLGRTLDAFRADALGITPAAIEAMQFLTQIDLPRPVLPAYRLMLDGAAATLPVEAATALGFRGSRRHVSALGALLVAMRTATGGSPSPERARRQQRD